MCKKTICTAGHMLELWKSKAWYVSDVLKSVSQFVYHSKLSSKSIGCIFWEQRLTLTLHNTTSENYKCMQLQGNRFSSLLLAQRLCHYVSITFMCKCKSECLSLRITHKKIPYVMYSINNISLNQVLIMICFTLQPL